MPYRLWFLLKLAYNWAREGAGVSSRLKQVKDRWLYSKWYVMLCFLYYDLKINNCYSIERIKNFILKKNKQHMNTFEN